MAPRRRNESKYSRSNVFSHLTDVLKLLAMILFSSIILLTTMLSTLTKFTRLVSHALIYPNLSPVACLLAFKNVCIIFTILSLSRKVL